MKEIEVKFKIESIQSYEEICKKFKKYGVDIIDAKTQKDTVFLLPEQQNKPIIEGSKIARIRLSTKSGIEKVILTLKVQGKQRLVSAEYEFEIKDEKTGKDFFSALGFVEEIVVKKRRITVKLDEYTMCIDEVYGLGCFIELELLSDEVDMNIEQIQLDMTKKLESFGLVGVISTIPYDTQLKNSRK